MVATPAKYAPLLSAAYCSDDDDKKLNEGKTLFVAHLGSPETI